MHQVSICSVEGDGMDVVSFYGNAKNSKQQQEANKKKETPDPPSVNGRILECTGRYIGCVVLIVTYFNLTV